MSPAISGEWKSSPRRPQLSEQVVDVWRADLTASTNDLGELLSADERARAERFVRAEDRRRWTRARAVLRALLSRYNDVDPRSLRFVTSARGKPALEGGAPGLRFNLSHSGGMALYAVTAGCAIGVDIELLGRRVDVLAIAKRVLGADAAQRLNALNPVVREIEFLRAWVRHEAVSKCYGTGLGATEAMAAVPLPWVTELDIGPTGAAALAINGASREVRFWAW